MVESKVWTATKAVSKGLVDFLFTVIFGVGLLLVTMILAILEMLARSVQWSCWSGPIQDAAPTPDPSDDSPPANDQHED